MAPLGFHPSASTFAAVTIIMLRRKPTTLSLTALEIEDFERRLRFRRYLKHDGRHPTRRTRREAESTLHRQNTAACSSLTGAGRRTANTSSTATSQAIPVAIDSIDSTPDFGKPTKPGLECIRPDLDLVGDTCAAEVPFDGLGRLDVESFSRAIASCNESLAEHEVQGGTESPGSAGRRDGLTNASDDSSTCQADITEQPRLAVYATQHTTPSSGQLMSFPLPPPFSTGKRRLSGISLQLQDMGWVSYEICENLKPWF
jgi:hypothetical protein